MLKNKGFSLGVLKNFFLDHWIACLLGGAYTGILILARNELAHLTIGVSERIVVISPKWKLFLDLISLSIPLTLLGLVGLILFNYRPLKKVQTYIERFAHPFFRGVFCVIGTFSLIFILTLSHVNILFTSPFMRLALILPCVFLAAWITPWPRNTSYFYRVGLFLLGTFGLFKAGLRLSSALDYPFSIGWSEGSNFWFSWLLFQNDQNLVRLAYFPAVAPGAYGLDGLPFLLSDLPIQIHRLWRALLDILPPFLIGIAALVQFRDSRTKLGLILWGALFLFQGPVIPPLLLVAILILSLRAMPFPIRLLAVGLAGFYAGVSRWTWVLAPAYWSILIELLYHSPLRAKNKFQQIAPSILLGLVGAIPGLFFLGSSHSILRDVQTQLSEPLLWYRLLPNATNRTGLVLGVILAFMPITVLLTWLAVTRRWKLSRLSSISIISGCLAMFVGGLIISVKIGGGSNLHNLDMFFVTLFLLAVVAVEQVPDLYRSGSINLIIKDWLKIPVILLVILPCWHVIQPSDLPPVLASQTEIQESLGKVKSVIEQASLRGEILFISERQLVTFNYISPVSFVNEYDKVMLMEQAMAGNIGYFEPFYQDLAQRRFVMIVTDPLMIESQGRTSFFGNENDAWIKWVAKPILEHYKVYLNTYPKPSLWLLIPKDNP